MKGLYYICLVPATLCHGWSLVFNALCEFTFQENVIIKHCLALLSSLCLHKCVCLCLCECVSVFWAHWSS